jgi:hypothetical protein
MIFLPLDVWNYIISYLYNNTKFYPLELTFLKLVSKDFNKIIFNFYNDNTQTSKLDLISHYFSLILLNKNYSMFYEFKNCFITLYTAIKVLGYISNNLEIIKFFFQSPLLTYDNSIKITLKFNKELISFVKNESDNENVITFLSNKMCENIDNTHNEYISIHIENFKYSKLYPITYYEYVMY